MIAQAQNIGGPIVALGHHMRLCAEDILASRVGSLGRTRALHMIAMAERSGSSATDRKPGLFDSSLCKELEKQLLESQANLQPEESRFKEITTWHDPVQIRRELRSNLHRLVNERQEYCVMQALNLHVLHDLHARYRGYPDETHLVSDDFYEHASLRDAVGRVVACVPEIVLWSKLIHTV
jgi:hypothetical protein